MAKVTEYSRITKLKDNDIFLVDGPDGTRTILKRNAAKDLGEEIIAVTKSGNEDKVTLNLTDNPIGLATEKDLDNVADALLPIGTASGNPAVITDAKAGTSFKELKVNIEPAQTGTGDPSPENVREIFGWTAANIRVSPTDGPTGGQTYSVSFPEEAGTVYGGVLNLTAGTLTVDRAFLTLTGTETWTKYTAASAARDWFYHSLGNLGSVIDRSGVCSHFAAVEISSYTSSIGQYVYNSSATARLAIRPDGIYNKAVRDLTVDEFKEWLAGQYSNGTPVQVAYELTEKTVYQLTPSQISALEGYNVVSADCGAVELIYIKDVNVQDMIAEESDDTATRAFAKGEYVIVKGKLYKVTADIASGAALVSGTNIEETTVGEELTEIGEEAREGVSELKTQMDDVEQVLFGDVTRNFTPNKNLDDNGEEIDDNTSSVSEFIPYTWTGYGRFYCSENGSTHFAYKIAFYDTNKVKLNVFKYPATDGTTYRNIDAETQVTGTPAFVKFSYEKNFSGKITNNANPPTVEYWIANEDRTQGLSEISAKAKLLLGSDSISFEASTLIANTLLKLDDAPWFVMKNQGVSARVKFSAFTSLAVGKGYMNYRGRWILIDGTYVHIYSTKEDDTYPGDAVQYDYKAHPEYIKQEGEWVENPAYEGPSAHSLTISDFIEVSMYETVDGKIRTNIVTLSGSFSVDIESLYRWNYAPFVLGGQDMTDVKIGYSCSDVRSPLWMFGDSYLGIAVNRIGGQLRNFGFTSYLMDGVAGGRAVDTGTPGKSVSGDVTKLLAMGTPQYIVWTLGMNGTISMNTDYIDTLMDLCASKGITLILYMPPSIPGNDKATLNSYIAATGLRYINAYAAVGANAQGEWYTGFLSSDSIHPSTLGAKAIAMRFIADVPELMQYGYSTGNVESESDDGDET